MRKKEEKILAANDALQKKPHRQHEMDRFWVESSERGVSEPALIIDIQGFEGPLDLLLHLARNQKVDLTRISIVALVEQYLRFIEHAQRVRLELAADYLVMAAWLAYLKSRLLVPKQVSDDGESGEELAEMLHFRLRRLEAMREAAGRLVERDQLGRDFFRRGAPEMVVVEKKHRYDASLYELLMAYAALRQRQSVSQVEVGRRTVWSLKHARSILERLLGHTQNWQTLDQYLLLYIPLEERVTALASGFAASLEMVREGQMEIRQSEAFAPIYLRTSRKAE